jgi:cell division protein FtsN
VAQDDYYYEIQLTNKQLVFYFLAAATGLILSFVAGLMVGRGLDTSAPGTDAAQVRSVQEPRIVSEEPSPTARTTPPPAKDLTYAQRLEAERVDEALTRPRPSSSPPGAAAKAPPPAAGSEARPASTPEPAPPAAPAATPRPAPTPSPKAAGPSPKPTAPSLSPTPRATPKASGAPKPAAGAFTIQVGAFKDKKSAESVVSQLKAKGFDAFVVVPEGADGLYNVRVGRFAGRADAERVQAKLRDQEKFKPFIVKQ